MSEEDEGYRELKWKTARHEKEIIKTKLRGVRTQQMFNYYSCKKNYHNSRLLYNKNMISKNKLVINILNRLKYVRISLFFRFHSSNNCWTILILLRRGVSTAYVSIVNTSVPMNSFDWHDISKSIEIQRLDGIFNTLFSKSFLGKQFFSSQAFSIKNCGGTFGRIFLCLRKSQLKAFAKWARLWQVPSLGKFCWDTEVH